MRQLDLFGNIIEIEAEGKKHAPKGFGFYIKEHEELRPTGEIVVSEVELYTEIPTEEDITDKEISIVEIKQEQLSEAKQELITQPVEEGKDLLTQAYNVPIDEFEETELVSSDGNEASNEALPEPKKNDTEKNSSIELSLLERTNELIIEKEPAETLQAIIENGSASRLNGSEIFNDGKISVKIKAKLPKVEPVIEEEKLNKVPQKRGRKSFKEIDAEVDLIEIPEDEVLFQRQYYPISQVAEWFKVNTSLIRFWENEFDILKPKKNRKGDRLFRPEDVKNLHLIYHLLRQRKYTIEGAKEYIKTNKNKADLQLQLITSLEKIKGFLLDLKANL
jgi:DNA-binding transcriptional MerR regulator